MKKIITLLALTFILTGCQTNTANTITVSATSLPHAEILEFAASKLKTDYGYDLDIIVTDDYYTPNKAVDNKDVDANFFQHLPFLEGEKIAHQYDIADVAHIHIEPIGLYSSTLKSIDNLPMGASIILSNSVADHGRILMLLEVNGFITLTAGIDKTKATLKDIESNHKNLVFKAEVAPELLTVAYFNNEADLVAINSNFALNANLNPLVDALVLEDATLNPYVNILVVHTDHLESDKTKALIAVLTSPEVRAFILATYKGAVIPANN